MWGRRVGARRDVAQVCRHVVATRRYVVCISPDVVGTRRYVLATCTYVRRTPGYVVRMRGYVARGLYNGIPDLRQPARSAVSHKLSLNLGQRLGTPERVAPRDTSVQVRAPE